MPRPKRAVPIERYTAMSLAQVSEQLGLTPMRIWQIEQKALEKIRQELIARGIVTPSGRWASR